MSPSHLEERHTVSAKLMAGEEADAVAAVVLDGNPQARVEDHGAYLSVEAENELVFDMTLITEELGRPYNVNTFLVVLSSYTGQVDVQDDRVVVTEMMAS